jgi:hypothetical protein
LRQFCDGGLKLLAVVVAGQRRAAVLSSPDRMKNTDARQPARDDHDGRTAIPGRIRIAVPPGGLGQRYARMTAWLDENCGADGWAMTPSGTRGVLNDAASIYFLDTTLAGAFVARWCAGYRVGDGWRRVSGAR